MSLNKNINDDMNIGRFDDDESGTTEQVSKETNDISRKKPKREYVCDFSGCTFQTIYAAVIERHRRIHIDEKPFCCDIPPRAYKCKRLDKLEHHKFTIHGVKKMYMCRFKECGFTSPNHDDLQTHKTTHIGQKHYKCDVCTYETVRRMSLEDHKRSQHSQEKPYTCPIASCTYVSATKDLLASHLRTHNPEKRHVCDFDGCHYRCAEASTLTLHKRTHSGEKPYLCGQSECNTKFATLKSLKLHQQTHTNEKEYYCDFADCTFRTARQSGITQHMLTHTGDKPYVCDVDGCEKRYRGQTSLRDHKLSHIDEKPYTCPHCSFCTVHRKSLRNHEAMHERQKSYEFGCKMQDGGTQLCTEEDIPCTIRCKTEHDMDVHIERNHTKEGIGKKFESETKLAHFLELNEIPFSRDWENYISFQNCKDIQGSASSARPDFFLLAESARLSATVLLGNDEFGHRHYPCELRRMWNIFQSQSADNARMLYIRFNPHNFKRDGMYHSLSLEAGHKLILIALSKITCLKPGLNLAYINYDRTNGVLDVLKASEENDYSFLQDYVILDM